MKFDWYQATIEQEPDYIRAALAEASGGDWIHAKPSRRSEKAQALIVDGEPIIELLEGGLYKAPHAISTGSTAPHAATIIRTACPEHLVARADACEDLQAPDFFDRAFSELLTIGRADRVKMERVGDWDSDQPSRTFRLGSTSSPVMLRMYEKGMEQRAKYPNQADEFSPDWVRLEVQVRPLKRVNKLEMASRPASDFFGCSRWTKKVAGKLLGLDAPRISIGSTYNRDVDLDRREYFMLMQYMKTMQQRQERLGSWEAVGQHYGHLIAAEERRRN